MITRDVVAELTRAGIVDVDTSALVRSLYASDASLYRVLPRIVVRPRHTDELEAVAEVARATGTPVTARGAGTSIAGNAVGPGIVLDTSRHLNRVLAVDADARTATVEPGVVHAALQAVARPSGLRFGPDPSTHNRCTIGGMIGNNACGSRALGYGRTSDNVVGLDVVTGAGDRLVLGPGEPGAGVLEPLRRIVATHEDLIRAELGRFGRQVSGYALEHLLPERGFDVARALVGSEGTLGLVLGATVRLVDEPAHRGLLVLGYPSIAEAADAAPGLLHHWPVACEGLDERIVGRLRSLPATSVPDLPVGEGWLMVEFTGDSVDEVESKARHARQDAACLDAMIVTDPRQAAALWRIREDGAGLASRTPDGRPAYAGWEDAAVPTDQLGSYLRDFDRLVSRHGLLAVPYGHFGDGCVHVRIDFPFGSADGTGLPVYRRFIEEAAHLVAGYGGSMSGEHGDGRARSELLPIMYSAEIIDLFAGVKGLLDPQDVLNPGVIVRPEPFDRYVRAERPGSRRSGLALAYRSDGGDFAAAVHRCTGVGKCRADLGPVGGVMCPSYTATLDEKDSTRGRARVLQEMVRSDGAVDGWRAAEVREALDLCLSCKGCSRDCPAGVDMASYKSEVLYQAYRRRLRPRSHYALGQLPRWARLAARSPRLVNAVLASRFGGRIAKWSAGVDQRRQLPRFASGTFRDEWRGNPDVAPDRPRVALWVDTMTDHFAPHAAHAAVDVLERAGYHVEVAPPSCCGLTWISTGQLDRARKVLGTTVAELLPYAEAGVPIVGIEPSCTAVLRHDASELLGRPEADRVKAAVRTLAEQLSATPGWTPPVLTGVEIVAQPHCHHHAVLGWEADERLLVDAGASLTRVGGCCGLAGNWGAERGHHDLSVRIAEQRLLPATRAAAPDAVILADGFSCRTQLGQLSGRPAVHLAELLVARSGADRPDHGHS